MLLLNQTHLIEVWNVFAFPPRRPRPFDVCFSLADLSLYGVRKSVILCCMQSTPPNEKRRRWRGRKPTDGWGEGDCGILSSSLYWLILRLISKRSFVQLTSWSIACHRYSSVKVILEIPRRSRRISGSPNCLLRVDTSNPINPSLSACQQHRHGHRLFIFLGVHFSTHV